MRVAAGDVPHRDFYAIYGPGQFYVLAGLFKLFGQTVLVERLYDATVKAGIVCLVYTISLPLMERAFAASVAGICALWLGSLGSAVYPIWPSLFLILLCVPPQFTVFEDRYSAPRLFWAGLAAGAVVLFRYDMGLLAIGVISAVLILYRFLGSKAPGRFLNKLVGSATLLAPFCFGAALIVVPLSTAYFHYGMTNDFVFQVVQFPAAHYVEMRRLPFLPIWQNLPWNLIVYFPPMAVLAYTAVTLSQFVQGDVTRGSEATNWIGFLLSAFAVGLYFKGVVRVSVIHLAPSIITSFIVLGFTAKRFLRGRHLPVRAMLAVLLVAPLASVELSTIWVAIFLAQSTALANLSAAEQLTIRATKRHNAAASEGPCDQPPELTRLRCFIVSDANEEALRFVVSNTAPGDTILVADGENDKTLANDNAFYFLTGRQPATKWHHFDPGLQSSEVIQGEIVRDMEEKKPPLIVIDTEWDKVEEPNGSAKRSGVKVLDSFIRDDYVEIVRVEPYRILRLRR
jgi:hypothetical protein